MLYWSLHASPLVERSWWFGCQFLLVQQFRCRGRKWTALHHPRYDHVVATTWRQSADSHLVTMALDAVAIWCAVHPHGAAFCLAKLTFYSIDPRHVDVHHCRPLGQVVSPLHVGGVSDRVPIRMTLYWQISTTPKFETASSLHSLFCLGLFHALEPFTNLL